MPNFGLGLPEIVVLAAIAIIIFGPEKLPEVARKAARVISYLRGIADGAREQLTDTLGADLTDFRPKDLVQNLLVGDDQAADDEFDEDSEMATEPGISAMADEAAGQAAIGPAPFDPEAT